MQKKKLLFENVWAKSVDFENVPKLAKVLRLSSKFWRITLKNVKMLQKN